MNFITAQRRSRAANRFPMRLAALIALAGFVAVLALVLARAPVARGQCINCPLTIAPSQLPDTAMGASFSQQLYEPDSQYEVYYKLPLHYSVMYYSSLPPGLSLTDAGLLSGTPVAPGSYVFDLFVEDSSWDSACGHTTMYLTVTGTNHPPTFTPGPKTVAVTENDPPYNAVWATNISKGGVEDNGQSLSYWTSNDNHALFSEQPAIGADGKLSFTLAPDASGVANVSFYITDNGGKANGGSDTSPTASFQIVVHDLASPQPGPTLTVNSTAWANDGSCTYGDCTLREAIETANRANPNQTQGAYTIELAPGAMYEIQGVDNDDSGSGNSPNGLPRISTRITINGHGASITRSAALPYARFFLVSSELTLNEVQLINGKLPTGTGSDYGGGAISNSGLVVVKNSYFESNHAAYGGAVADSSTGGVHIYNSTFYENSALAQGGAIWGMYALDLYNNTFYNNTAGSGASAADSGGALWASRPSNITQPWNFYNNLFVGLTSGPQCFLRFSASDQSYITILNNLATDTSCKSATSTPTAINLVAPPDYNGGPTKNMAFQADTASPAIDTGHKTGCSNTNINGRDQRGKDRFAPGSPDSTNSCDIGAYEYSYVALEHARIALDPPDPNGTNGWYGSPVTVKPLPHELIPLADLRCVLDPASPPAAYDDLPAEACPYPGDRPVLADGPHTFYVAVQDDWGNKTEPVARSFKIDATPPVIPCPAGGPFLLGSGQHSLGPAGVDASVSGLNQAASTLSGSVTTETVGPKRLTFRAVDWAGNQATQDCTYWVIYDFGGPYPPVELSPAFNEVKAGSAVPFKFSLGGDQGSRTLFRGYPATQQVDCTTLAPRGEPLPAEPAGESALSYEPGNGRYSYVWKTDKAWTGTCRALIIWPGDEAYFRFK